MKITDGRTELVKGDLAIAFGRDHACGLFIQIWKIDPALPLNDFENLMDDHNVVVDRDQLFNKLTIEEFVDIAHGYGFVGFDAQTLKNEIG